MTGEKRVGALHLYSQKPRQNTEGTSVKQSPFFRWIRRHPIAVTVVAVLVIVGLLSFHTIRQRIAELLAQRDYLYQQCTEIDWSPNQTQFIFSNRCAKWETFDLSVYSIDGTIQYGLPSSFVNAFWSPDGQYVAVATCQGSHAENAYVFSIFDASSGNKLCTVGSGSPIICPNFDRTCHLPLKDGRTWIFTGHLGMGAQIDISICDNVGNCTTPNR